MRVKPCVKILKELYINSVNRFKVVNKIKINNMPPLIRRTDEVIMKPDVRFRLLLLKVLQTIETLGFHYFYTSVAYVDMFLFIGMFYINVLILLIALCFCITGLFCK